MVNACEILFIRPLYWRSNSHDTQFMRRGAAKLTIQKKKAQSRITPDEHLRGIGMYLEHFAIQRFPFPSAPDFSLFYPGGNRSTIVDAMAFAIESGEAILKVVGDVGSGKTTLCNALAKKLAPHYECVILQNPNYSPEDILLTIASELGMDTREQASRVTMMAFLSAYLDRCHAEHRGVVLLIDEAQGMPRETLEEVRLLSNLEVGDSVFYQIVLFGQPELDGHINQHTMRQLRERINHGFTLEPLTLKETGRYLERRLNHAGYRGPTLFSPEAIRLIHLASRGGFRRINMLAHKSLMATYADRQTSVHTQNVIRAIRDCHFPVALFSRLKEMRPVFAKVAILLLVTLGLALTLRHLLTPSPGPLMAQSLNTTREGTPADIRYAHPLDVVNPTQERKPQ